MERKTKSKTLIVLATLLLLSSCSLMPSKWDVNQARVVTNIRIEEDALDCTKDVTPQLIEISNDLKWLHIYSNYKGTSDLDYMVSAVQKTVTQFQTNMAAKPSNMIYCVIKKTILIQQTDIIGHTIKGSLP